MEVRKEGEYGKGRYWKRCSFFWLYIKGCGMDFDTRFEAGTNSIGDCPAICRKRDEDISAGTGMSEKG